MYSCVRRGQFCKGMGSCALSPGKAPTAAALCGVSGTDLATGCTGLCSRCSLRRCLLYRELEHFTRSLQAKHKTRPCRTGQSISSSCLLEHIFKYITLYFFSNGTFSSRNTVMSCACVVMAITAVSSFQRKGPVI